MFDNLVKFLNALYYSLYDLINIALVTLLVWLTFGIFGVIIYANKMGFCENYDNYYTDFKSCQENQKEWINYQHNFDNIFNAINTLFLISSMDGWGEIMFIC